MRRPRCGALNRVFLRLIACTPLCRLVMHATYSTISKNIHQVNQLKKTSTIVIIIFFN
ncbi:hypothetical protein Hanom_Chr15g01341061 [Helianthus anomalus]